MILFSEQKTRYHRSHLILQFLHRQSFRWTKIKSLIVLRQRFQVYIMKRRCEDPISPEEATRGSTQTVRRQRMELSEAEDDSDILMDPSCSSSSFMIAPEPETLSVSASAVETTNQPIIRLDTNKAGMSGLTADDIKRINQNIENISAGSSFYMHQSKLKQEMSSKELKLQQKYQNLQEKEKERSLAKVDAYLKTVLESQDLNQVFVHIDMDAFFVSVEIRDNPSLRGKPVAVGSYSMLSTANYEARKKGVRSAMPGFIAKKLCPELIIVPVNMEKYSAASKNVQEIIREVDFTASMFMDEARLNITDLMRKRGLIDPGPVIDQLRERIFQKTGLTASAGIAPNGKLAKICSDMNKPNGQFILPGDPDKIRSFLNSLDVGKVRGIGKVTKQLLNGLNIHSCQDLYNMRGVIPLLFTPATANFLILSSVGVGGFGEDSSSDDSEDHQKSMSFERTFSSTEDDEIINSYIQEACDELSQTLESQGLEGLTVTVKVKTSDFDVRTKSQSLMAHTCDSGHMYRVSLNLLKQIKREQLQKFPNFRVRLIGVRMSSLRDSSTETLTSDTNGESENNLIKPKVKQPTLDELSKKISAKSESNWLYCPICPLKFESFEIAKLRTHVELCLEQSESGGDMNRRGQDSNESVEILAETRTPSLCSKSEVSKVGGTLDKWITKSKNA